MTRLGAGWLIGVPTGVILGAAVMGASSGDMNVPAFLALLGVERFFASMLLIQFCLAPRRGWRESAFWALLCVALSTAIDVVLFTKFADADWMRIPWC